MLAAKTSAGGANHERLPATRLILNIIWFVFAGFWLAVGYALAALVMFILIITIPFGVQSLKLASYSLWPFGRTIVKKPSAGAGSVIGNVIWIVLAGWWIALAHLITAIPLAITIIGIPLAYANLKLIPIALWPFGREIVPNEMAAASGEILVAMPSSPRPRGELPPG